MIPPDANEQTAISHLQNMNFSSKLPNVGTTIFTVMSKLANEHGAINLSQGFPNFDTSDNLKKLVEHYMAAGKNQYAPMAGVPALRQQLAQKIESLYNLKVNSDTEITITGSRLIVFEFSRK